MYIVYFVKSLHLCFIEEDLFMGCEVHHEGVYPL